MYHTYTGMSLRTLLRPLIQNTSSNLMAMREQRAVTKVHVHICIYTYICIYIYIYIIVYVFMYMYTSIYICVCICVSICIDEHFYICIYI
jgi:hypothetical protein